MDIVNSFFNVEASIKILILTFQVVYTIIAFIMVRQVKLMNNSFTTSMKPVFIGLARLHLLASTGVIIFSLLIL